MPNDAASFPDPLVQAERPDRPYYETGVLLDAEDFSDEQTYHRARLARSLAWLHGSGTIAGLRVMPPVAIGTPPRIDRELVVQPGLALDRYGRLIEVPRPWCIRLNRWYEDLAGEELGRDQLAAAFRAGAFGGSVVVDVFIAFENCPRGKTPSFADGAVDATDATVPQRLRDGFRLLLAVRDDVPADPSDPRSLPVNRFSALAAGADANAVRDALLDAWNERLARPGVALDRTQGQPVTVDPAAVFLARMFIPAAAPVGDAAPVPDFTTMDPTRIDNRSRVFVVPGDLAARLAGL
jgi:hypothetical protein